MNLLLNHLSTFSITSKQTMRSFSTDKINAGNINAGKTSTDKIATGKMSATYHHRNTQLSSLRIIVILCSFFVASLANSDTIYRYIDPQGRLLFTDKPKHEGYIPLEKTTAGWTVKKTPTTSWKQNQQRLSPTIKRIANKYDLSHHLVHAVIMVESTYNPQAKSKAGAQGLMQLMPATARRFGVNDPYNPTENIDAGTEYLKHLLKLFNNDLSLALAAYNAGENAVKRYNNQIPPFKETQRYVEKVLHHYEKYLALN